MAIHLNSFIVNPSAGGNNSIVVGGSHNVISSTPWTNRLAGATAMTGLLTLTPTGTLTTSSAFYGSILGNEAGNAFQGTFRIEVTGGTTNKLTFQCWDGRAGDGNQQYSRRAITIDPVLVIGQQVRIGVRWRALDQRIEIWLNGREAGVERAFLHNATVMPGPTGVGVPVNLTRELSAMGPIEIGARSHTDRRAFTGIYSEVALFSGWLSTGDMVNYGRGWSPNLLESGLTARVRYVDLRSDRPTWTAAGFGTAGTVVDRWTGQVFGNHTSGAQGDQHYGGIFESYQRTNHPLVYESIPPTDHDVDAVPIRYVEPGEKDLSGIGARSGTVTPVATAAALRAALIAAQYGDIIEVDATASVDAMTLTQSLSLPDSRTQTLTASTPRMPPRSTRHLSGRTPLSSAAAPVPLGTPSCEACEPAYVLVRSSAAASLPAITHREIPLPTGEVIRTPHESAKVNDTHYGAMATVRAAAAGDTTCISNTTIPFSHVAFHGIRFQSTATQSGVAGQFFNFPGVASGFSWGWNPKTYAGGEHLLFTQCAMESDPLNTGCSVGAVANAWEGRAFAIVNCLIDKVWSQLGGDGKMFGMGGQGPGTFCFENTDLRATAAMWFSGGGGSSIVPVEIENVLIRRVWLGPPLAWFPSEVHQWGGLQRVTVTGTTVTRVGAPEAGNAGLWRREPGAPLEQSWGVIAYTPEPTGIMYEPATGIARAHTMPDHYVVPQSTLPLTAAWPASGTIDVQFQRTTPDPATTPTVYNSGVETPLVTATVTAGSRTVTVSAPLPAAVEVGHYFYLNNTRWHAAFQGNLANVPVFYTPAVNHNGWGHLCGTTRARSKRKQIATIAADRLSFTYDPTQDAFTGQDITDMGAATFPYSIVRHDGLYRDTMYHYKGSWENKRGKRWCQDGNVFEHTTNRAYNLCQPGGNNFLGTVTIATDASGISTATLASGTWDSDVTFRTALRYARGSPWTYAQIFNASGPGTYIPENPPPSRMIKRLISPTVAELLPLDPRLGTQPGDGTRTMAYTTSSTPWSSIAHFIVRYNLWTRGNGAYAAVGEASQGMHVIPGGHFLHHDNLMMRLGDRAFPDGHAVAPLFIAPSSNASASYQWAPGGQAGYDEPLIPGRNGIWRADHNTLARTIMSTAQQTSLVSSWFGGSPQTPRTARVSVSDNLVADIASNSAIIGLNAKQAIQNITGGWADEATTAIARNVFAGPFMPARTIGQLTTQFPDNGAVAATATQVGIGPNWYATDGYDPFNYVLQDIATVAPFTIGADGLHAALTSGSLPATVAVGQFCKTTTHPELHRVLHIGPLYRVVATTQTFTGADVANSLGAAWEVLGGVGWGITNNQARLVGPQAAGRVARCTVDVGTADFEIEATLTELAFVFNAQAGVHTRMSAGGAATYWRFGTGNSVNGDPLSKNYRLIPVVNGAAQFSEATDVLMPAQVGDRIGLRSVGSVHQAFINGRLVAERTSTTNPTGTFGGIGGVCTAAGDAVALDDVTIRTASGTTGLVWDGLPHQEAGATGKSLVFTFKGTARDGTDPGADIPTLAAMIQGVRNPARAAQ